MTPESLQKSAKKYQHKLGASRGVLNPRRFFQIFTLRCYEPSIPLRPFISHYWILRWDSAAHPHPQYEYILTGSAPDLYLQLPQPYIKGITHKKILITAEGKGVSAGIRFKSGGLYSFWRHDLRMLDYNKIPAAEVFPWLTTQFLRHLYNAHDDQQICDRLETGVMTVLPEVDQALGLITAIVEDIEKGLFSSVGEIAHAHHISERTLHHLFVTRVGVGVKWLLMRHRLLHATQYAHKYKKPNWGEVAANLGYSTQSHFINEFKTHIGVPPSVYLQSIDTQGELPVLEE